MKGHVIVEYRNPDTGEVLERSEGDNHVFVDQFKLLMQPFTPESASTGYPYFVLSVSDGQKTLDPTIPCLPGLTCGGGTEYNGTANQMTGQAGYSSSESDTYWNVEYDGSEITLKKSLVFDFLPDSPYERTVRYVGLASSPNTPWASFRSDNFVGSYHRGGSRNVASDAMMFPEKDIGYAVSSSITSTSSLSNAIAHVVTLSTGNSKVVHFTDILPENVTDWPTFKADSIYAEKATPSHYGSAAFTACNGKNFYIYTAFCNHYYVSRKDVYVTKVIKYTADLELTHADTGVDECEVEDPNRRYALLNILGIYNGYFYSTRSSSSSHQPVFRFKTIEDYISNNVENCPTSLFDGHREHDYGIFTIYSHYLILHGWTINVTYTPTTNALIPGRYALVYDLSDYSVYSQTPDYIAYPRYNEPNTGCYALSIDHGVKGWNAGVTLPFGGLITAYQIPNADSRPKGSAMRIIYQLTCKIH